MQPATGNVGFDHKVTIPQVLPASSTRGPESTPGELRSNPGTHVSELVSARGLGECTAVLGAEPALALVTLLLSCERLVAAEESDGCDVLLAVELHGATSSLGK